MSSSSPRSSGGIDGATGDRVRGHLAPVVGVDAFEGRPVDTFVDRIAHGDEDRHEHHGPRHSRIEEPDRPLHGIRLVDVGLEAQRREDGQGYGGTRDDRELGDDGPERGVLRLAPLARVELVVVDHVRLHRRAEELSRRKGHAPDHEEEHHPGRRSVAVDEARQGGEEGLAGEREDEAQDPHLLLAVAPGEADEQGQRDHAGAVAEQERDAHPFDPVRDAEGVAEVEGHQHADAAGGDRSSPCSRRGGSGRGGCAAPAARPARGDSVCARRTRGSRERASTSSSRRSRAARTCRPRTRER